MPWLLNFVYFLLLMAASPVLLYRAIVLSKYRSGWGEKLFGLLPRRNPDRPCLWFHAVSVGEVLQLQSVLCRLEKSLPDFEFVITTTTSTGFAVAKEKYPLHQVCYFPLDFSWAVRNALQRIQPTAVVLVELELWPNFITAVDKSGIPLGLINGRMSETSYRGYRRIRPLMKRLLQKFSLVAVQNKTFANRLIDLGASSERVEVTGSIKFDGVEVDRQNAKTQELRQAFHIDDDDPVFIAGSTQSPEEEFALDTWLELQKQHPTLRLILVPRHKERFEEVAAIVKQRGLPLIRRSESVGSLAKPTGSNPWEPPPVVLLDTLGELAACWGLADIAFVGGSLTNRGGQNMLEPAAYGAAVLFGPNTRNFRQIVDSLLTHRAACVVRDNKELTRTVGELLEHPDIAKAQGTRAREFVLSQQGATSRTVSLISTVLVQPSNDRQSQVNVKAA